MHSDVIGSKSENGRLINAFGASWTHRDDAGQFVDVVVQFVSSHLLRHVPHLPGRAVIELVYSYILYYDGIRTLLSTHTNKAYGEINNNSLHLQISATTDRDI